MELAAARKVHSRRASAAVHWGPHPTAALHMDLFSFGFLAGLCCRPELVTAALRRFGRGVQRGEISIRFFLSLKI